MTPMNVPRPMDPSRDGAYRRQPYVPPQLRLLPGLEVAYAQTPPPGCDNCGALGNGPVGGTASCVCAGMGFDPCVV